MKNLPSILKPESIDNFVEEAVHNDRIFEFVNTFSKFYIGRPADMDEIDYLLDCYNSYRDDCYDNYLAKYSAIYDYLDLIQ